MNPPQKVHHLAVQQPLVPPRVPVLAFALFLAGATCIVGEFYIVTEFLVLFAVFALLFALATAILLLYICIHELIRRSYRLIHEAATAAPWHTGSVKPTLAP